MNGGASSHVTVLVLCMTYLVAQFCDVESAAGASIRRLVPDVVPLRYTIRIDTRFKPHFDFQGNVLIEVHIRNATDAVVFHAEKLKFSSPVFLGPYHPLIGKVSESTVWTDIDELFTSIKESGRKGNVKIDNEHLLIREHDNSTFEYGTYLFYFNYTGSLGDILQGDGLYKDYHVIESENKTEWLASTVFETSRARRAFPCFDEPNMKSRFRIILSKHETCVALSNMPSARTEPIANREGWYWEYFHETPPMSTFLLSYFIGEYGYWESGNGLKLWAGTSKLNSSVDWILEKGDIAFDEIQRILGPNPLPKQDLLAIPHFTIAEAVENWGLLTFREGLILEGTTGRQRRHKLSVLVHELAHNWFGNLVTPKWWSDVWFSEGFATYYSTVVTQLVMPEWDVKTWDTIDNFILTWALDAQPGVRSLSQSVESRDELDFGPIVYCKGFAIVRLVNSTIGGEKILGKGVSQYLKDNEFGLFSESSLWNTLEMVAAKERNLSLPVPLESIMKTWVQLPGMPLIRVQREQNNKTIIITQERYVKRSVKNIIQQKEEIFNNASNWWIPINVITNEDDYFNKDNGNDPITPQHWLKPGEKLIINDEKLDHASWLLINPHIPVPCHILYDNWNYEELTALDFISLPELMQSQMLNDVSRFAMDGLIPVPLALNIIKKILNVNRNYSSWRIALLNLNQFYILSYGTETEKPFQEYMQKLISPQFNRLQLSSNTQNESMEIELLTPYIAETACSIHLKECLKEALTIFKQWKTKQQSDLKNMIRDDVRTIIYCTAVDRGSNRDWLFLWEKLKNTVDKTDRKSIIDGLACTKNIQQLEKYLMMSVNGTNEFKSKKERKLVLNSVVKNPASVDVVLNFIMNHKDEIKKAYSRTGRKYNWRKVTNNIAPLIRNEQQMSKLRQLLINTRSTETMDLIINAARWAIQWRQNNVKIIKNWLQLTK